MAAREVQEMKVAELVLDYNLYPRHQVDEYQISEMADALNTGQRFPPIIADADSLRVIDGFHRASMYKRVYGPEAVCLVELRHYKNEGEMLADAMRLNASHGRRLTAYDYVRCVQLGESLGLKREGVAACLHISRERLDNLVATRVSKEGDVLKRSMAHLAGEPITGAQREYNRIAGGRDQLFYIRQVAAMIESGAIDLKRPKVFEAIQGLGRLIQEKLASIEA